MPRSRVRSLAGVRGLELRPVGRVESGWGHGWARLVVVSDASIMLLVVSISAETVRDLWQAKLAATSEPFRSEGSPGEDRLVRLLRTMPIPVLELDPARTWPWSDLHLGDPVMLAAWARPFRNVEHMNRSLLAQWRRRVRPGDTLVCLGDVVYLDAWFDPDFAVDLAACPGDRLLIIGNHDVDQFEELGRAGFGRQYAAAVCATSPPFVLTHVPLREVPRTAVNLHGHLHGHPAPSPRHRNLSVERIGYAPIRLDEVLVEVSAHFSSTSA